MIYDVHIISIGKKAETAFNVIGSDLKFNKIYLLNNDSEEYVAVENEIRDAFENFPLDGIVTAKINPFDYDDVFKTVVDLYHKELEEHPEGVQFHINFTMGTRVAVAAMCSAAYSINADLYYVQESIYSDTGKDKLIQIQIENLNELVELKSKRKILETFRLFSDGKPKTNGELIGPTESASNISYRTAYLCKAGLIERTRVREGQWSLTDKGKQVMKRI